LEASEKYNENAVMAGLENLHVIIIIIILRRRRRRRIFRYFTVRK